MTRSIFGLCAVCFILFFFNLQSRDFWAPDEGDFAQIAMELSDNPVVPTLNGKPYGEKPPLFYYIIYASKMIVGLADEVSLRLPSAIFALLGTILLFLTVGRFVDWEGAILSSCILVTTPLYYWQARYLQVDMVFSVLVSSSLLLFFWFYMVRRDFILYLSFFALSLAFLTKGPLAIALVVPIAIITLAFDRSLGIIKLRVLGLSLLLCVLVVFPWYVAVYLKEGAPYLYENIVRQNFVRFFDAWSHKRPFYYYFKTLPLDFFPWSLFLPFGLYISVRQFKSNPTIRYFLVWFLWMFLFLSLSSGKISKYMLPALPALAILTSTTFRRGNPVFVSTACVFLGIILCAAAIGLLFFKKALYPEFYSFRVAVAGLSLALTLSLIILSKRPAVLSFVSIATFLFIIYTLANIVVYEKWNYYKSPRYMAEKMRPFVSAGIPWVFYGSMRGVYVYYVGKQAIHVDEHDTAGLRMVAEQLDSFYIFTKKRDLPEVLATVKGAQLLFADERRDGSTVFLRFSR